MARKSYWCPKCGKMFMGVSAFQKHVNSKKCSLNRAKRISAGHYNYRGFEVYSVGYYHAEHHVCWEAVDNNGCGFAHSFSLAMTKKLIDNELDN